MLATFGHALAVAGVDFDAARIGIGALEYEHVLRAAMRVLREARARREAHQPRTPRCPDFDLEGAETAQQRRGPTTGIFGARELVQYALELASSNAV